MLKTILKDHAIISIIAISLLLKIVLAASSGILEGITGNIDRIGILETNLCIMWAVMIVSEEKGGGNKND